MSDILHTIENFINTCGFYLTLGLLFIILIINIFFVASIKRRIKKFEEKYSEPIKIDPFNYVSLETTQPITGEKTFCSKKSVPARDEKGRFVKR